MINALELYRQIKNQWDTTSQPLKERASVLPLGQYEDGSVGMAWPELLAAPAEGVANFGTYGYGEDAVPYNSRMAFDAAGGAMTGGLGVGLAGGMADNALGSAGGNLMKGASDLPMDLASRMASERAQPQGIRAYHGTASDFDAVNTPSMWATTNPGNASSYAMGLHRGGGLSPEGARVLPVDIRGSIYDATSLQNGPGLFDAARELARAEGANAIKYAGGNYEAIQPGTVYSATTGDLLYSNAKQGAAVPLAIDAAERAQPQGIRAYHGSPHDFDRFSLDKIGTGEGAQAYGHGLYFADSEDVARSYRDTLSKQQFDPKVTQDTPELRQAAQEWLQKQGYDPAPEQIEQTVQQITQGGFAPSDFDWSKVGAEGPKGRMYEVNIKANPEDFLDWDKPLSEQQRLVDLFGVDEQGRLKLPNGERVPPDKLRGESFYRAVSEANAGGRGPASDALREAGIPGIKYLDGMSRDGGAGTSNYVVFDDALIDILRKYSNAPTAAAIPAGMEAAQTDTDPALLQVLRQYGMI